MNYKEVRPDVIPYDHDRVALEFRCPACDSTIAIDYDEIESGHCDECGASLYGTLKLVLEWSRE